MTSKKSSGSPLKFTFRQSFRSLSTFIAFAMCGIIAFCTTLFTVSELFGTSAVYDDHGNITEYVVNKNSYHFLLFRAVYHIAIAVLTFKNHLISHLSGILLLI